MRITFRRLAARTLALYAEEKPHDRTERRELALARALLSALDELEMAELAYPKWRRIWEGMSEGEREPLSAKAQWEYMILWAVLNDWPSLLPERFRAPAEVEE